MPGTPKKRAKENIRLRDARLRAEEEAILREEAEWKVGNSMDLSEKRRAYNASRTCSSFLMSYDDGVKFKCIRGPIGDGKSVMCCMYIVHKSSQQAAVTVVEGGMKRRIRHSKWLIARHTFKALEETTVATWNQWFGDKTRWRRNPWEGRYEDVLEDGSILRIDFVCYATESRNIMNDLQSLELSGAWVNEAVQSPYDVVARIFTRIGRFNPYPGAPGAEHFRSFHVIMDTNSPSETNWWYQMEVVKQPEGWLFWVCPPALLEERDRQTGEVRYVPNDLEHAAKRGCRPAENVKQIDGGYHDGMGYWVNQLSVLSEDDIRKLLLNRFGLSVAGMAVYAESWDVVRNRIRRGSESSQFDRGMMILIGLDLGRTPAAVLGQVGRDGKLRVKREVTTRDRKMNGGKGGLKKMDVLTFFDTLLRPALVELGWPAAPVVCFCDPAGKNCTEVSSICVIDHLRERGLNAIACDMVRAYSSSSRDITEGNNVNVRLSCVEQGLRSGEIQIAEECEMLCEGMAGRYCYRQMRSLSGDGAERYEDKPSKDDWSHIQDALQYLALAVFKGAADYSRPSSDVLSASGSSCDVDVLCDSACI